METEAKKLARDRAKYWYIDIAFEFYHETGRLNKTLADLLLAHTHVCENLKIFPLWGLLGGEYLQKYVSTELDKRASRHERALSHRARRYRFFKVTKLNVDRARNGTRRK